VTNILGLNFGHDGAAALIVNGRLRCAISNERLSRQKKAIGVTLEMIEYVIREGGIALSDIEWIAFSSYLYLSSNEIKLEDLNGREIQGHVIDLFGGETAREFRISIAGKRFKAVLIHHHIAHCASAFYTSPFERSACFSVDASLRNPEVCSLFAYGDGNKLYYLKCPGTMIGNAYSIFTEKLGLGPGLTKAGTTMGLAPYGQPNEVAKSRWREFGRSVYERHFQPSELVFINEMWGAISGKAPHVTFSKEHSDSPEAMNIAASLQFIFEESLLATTRELFTLTDAFNDRNLCLSGGSFLNSETNMRIKRETDFKNVHLFPACGDDGTAAGAALYLLHHILNGERQDYAPRDCMYLGREYKDPPQGEPLSIETVARELSEGKVVAWARGRSEFGPRALGNRSILADPRNPLMKEHLNKTVKRREWFRPFAPVVLSEEKTNWFDIDFESKLMLFIAKIRYPEQIPAVSHVNHTARLQTVSSDENPELCDLIKRFAALTGVPILLNTSLNGNNEPLVETPNDALRFYETAPVNRLVLGNTMFGKEVAENTPLWENRAG